MLFLLPPEELLRAYGQRQIAIETRSTRCHQQVALVWRGIA
jgi:hypothetical protein